MKQLKFKVGDEVRLRIADKKGVIIAEYNQNRFDVDTGDTIISTSGENLELIKTNMTKKDLKDGMILKFRVNHSDRIFIKGNLYSMCEGRLDDSLLLKDLNDDLTNKGGFGNSLDVVLIHWPSGEVIWQREEEVVMTISEIEAALNIKNLKIKK